ncbi:AbiH family protein [Bifidobacterium mizhiense]|uniref:AbiH family protein n=1 Tax=Bifidobacterium mizhiense TaxID=2879940 RepID=UPI001E6005D5|nr:AbiH family protein [Bifidobacterium mizhiense]
MSVPDQLVILGNGFDLQCGLASSFGDFEKPRKGLIEDLIEKHSTNQSEADTSGELVTYPDDCQERQEVSLAADIWAAGITVWDLILIADEQIRTWYDVEACIRDWLLKHPGRGEQLRNQNNLYAVKHQYSRYQQALIPGLHDNPYEMAVIDHYWDDGYFSQMPVNEQVSKLLLRWYACNADDNSIMKVMMQELHRLEAAFSSYMKNEADGNEYYRSHACLLLQKLMNDQLSDYDVSYLATPYRMDSFALPWSPPEDARVMDFNYTDPTYGIKPALTLINIHGNIHGGEIIFGIDSNSVDTDDSNYSGLVKFTKTYRLMALDRDLETNLVYPHVSGQPGSETSMIKFFGHSLGDPDYSYFQAIFDEVNLYGSDTRLVFYYNQKRLNENEDDEKGKNTTSESAQEKMFEKVNRLITTYGQTLDNKDHGRNLMHKLLLENRLQVVQAPV